MPSFAYIAMNERGQRTGGACQAADMASAVASLRADRLFVLEIRPTAEPAAPSPGVVRARLRDRFARSIRTSDQIQFLRQMCLMLRSGLPLLHALEVFARQCSRAVVARAVRRTAERIQAGQSLSTALAEERSLLPPLALRMIAIGETIGELDGVMDRVATHLERRAEIRSSLLTSLAYPMILVIATIGVVAFLVTNVIPKFVQLLSSRSMSMPPAAQWLMDATNFLNTYGLHLLGGLVGVVLLLFLGSLVRPVRYAMDRAVLSIPIVGQVIRLAFLAHVGRTLSALLRSGVPILDALRTLAQSVSNRALAARVQAASDDVLGGRPLSAGLRCRLIPPLLPELVAVGEASGTLDTVLDDAGDYYETRLRRTVKWMAGLFEPAMILIVGGIVGFVYIAFFSVLYQVSAGR